MGHEPLRVVVGRVAGADGLGSRGVLARGRRPTDRGICGVVRAVAGRLAVLRAGGSAGEGRGRAAAGLFGDEFRAWPAVREPSRLPVCTVGKVWESIGSPEPFELPFWNGEYKPPEPGYPLPFHPLEMADAALRSVLGAHFEGAPGLGLVDPSTWSHFARRRQPEVALGPSTVEGSDALPPAGRRPTRLPQVANGHWHVAIGGHCFTPRDGRCLSPRAAKDLPAFITGWQGPL